VRSCLVLNNALEGMFSFPLASRRERTELLDFISICQVSPHRSGYLRAPLASLGAVFRQLEQSLEEQGMSCRRYSSRTIFWTLPLFVDLTYTLLEIFEAYGSDANDLLRLVMLFGVWGRLMAGQRC
jgi:hypothetical protein